MRTKKQKEYHARYRKINKERIKIRNALYYLAHKKEHSLRTAAYYQKHKKECNARSAAYNAEHPEISSVRSHYNAIIVYEKNSYKGMPFYDGWNPNKGGSFKNGEKWIIDNLGKRPEDMSLHIIEHEKGFVPGNLAWATKKTQSAERMFKIIIRLKHENKKLIDKNKKLRKKLREALSAH